MGVWRHPWVRRVGAACVLLVAIALIVAHAAFVRSRVRDRAVVYAREAYGIDARIGDLSYNLFTLDVTLKGVTLAPVDRPDQPFMTADRLHIDLPWRALIGSLALQNAEVDRPRVTLVQAADGTLNLPTPPASTASSAPLNQLPLDRLALNDGGITFRDAAGSLAFAASGLTLLLAPAPMTGIGGMLAPGKVHLRTASGETSGVLTGGLAFDGRALRLNDVRLTAAEGDLRSTGHLVLLDKRPSVALETRGTLDGAALARWAGLRDLAGRAAIDVEVRGALAQPEFRARVSSDRLGYQGVAATAVRVEASGTTTAVDVSSLEMTLAGGRVEGDGHLAIAAAMTSDAATSAPSGTAANRASLRWTDVDVDRLLRELAIAVPAPARARASGTLNLQWDTIDRLAGTLTSDLRAPDEGLNGRARLAMADGRWTLDLAHRFLGMTLDGAARGVLAKSSVLDSTLTGTARLTVARLADLQSTMTRAGVALPAGLKEIEGALQADAVLSGTIRQPAAALRVDARDVRSPDLPGRLAELALALNATGDVTRARAHITRLRAIAGRNEIDASGTYAFDGPGRFSSQFTATLHDLATLARLTASDRPIVDSPAASPTTSTSTSPTPSPNATPVITGDATIAGSASGTIARPTANVTLAARDLVYGDLPIGRVDGTVALANGVATISAAAPDHHAAAQGTLGIASPYRLDAHVDATNTDLARLIPPAQRKMLPPVAGTLTARFVITGPLADPSALAIDADLRQFAATVDRTPIALRQPARLQYASRRISADTLDLTIGADSHVTVAGSIGDMDTDAAGQPLALTIDASLQDIEPFVRLAGRTRADATPQISTPRTSAAPASELPLTLRGRVKGTTSASGSARRPRLSGALQLENASATWADLPPVTASGRVTLADGVASLTPFSAAWQGATLIATGAFPLRLLGSTLPEPITVALPPSTAPATLDARLDNVTLDLLSAFIDRDRLAGSTGKLAATLQMRARGVTMNDVEGEITLTDGAFTLAGVPVRQAEPTRLSVAHGVARVDALRWTSGNTQLTGAGTIALTESSPRLDLALAGGVDLRLVSAFARTLSTAGRADLDLRVTGAANAPSLAGALRFANGELRMQEPRVIISAMTGGIRFDGTRLITDNLRGIANGGPITIDGSVAIDGFTPGDGRIRLNGRGIGLEYPRGLETESNVDLVATLASGVPSIAGKVTVVNGSYRAPLLLSGQLLSSARPSGIATTATSDESLLSKLQLNIAVVTQRDLRVDNNYGKLGLGADLRVTGTPAAPAVIGRAEIREGGQVYLAGNTYTIRTGTITFINPSYIEPELDISAETTVQQYPIEVAISGTPSALETSVRSMNTSAASDADAMSLLLTGRKEGSSDPEDYGRQIAQALSGELFGVAGRAIGLDTLRIATSVQTSDLFVDPTLIAGETDPTARLTLGKRLNRDVELVFSQDLTSSRFTWLTRYTAPWRVSAQAVVRDDRSRSYEIRHEPRLGRGDRPRRGARRPRQRVASVQFTGSMLVAEGEIEKVTRLHAGDRFAFARWQDERERLERFFHDRGYLEARVSAQRTDADPVALVYDIVQGPKTVLAVEGLELPASVRDQIAQRWKSAVFDGFLQQDTERIIRGHLASVDRPRATVRASVESSASPEETKTLRVTIDPGPPIAVRTMVFEGNVAMTSDRLQAYVDQQQLALAPWLDPKALEDALTQFYRVAGFLAAKVRMTPPVYTAGAARTVVKIEEGAPFTVGGVRVRGEAPERPVAARRLFDVDTGARYEPARIERGRRAIESRYRQDGFLSARVEVSTAVDVKRAEVDVALTVHPGSQSVLTDIIVEGGDTSRRLVSRALKLDLDTPVDPTALVAARRRLYDLNVFRRVDVETEPLPDTAASASAPGAPVPVAARVTLEEIPRYSLRYGFIVNDVADAVTGDRTYSTGVAADLRNRNILGRAMSGGVTARYQVNQQLGRLFISTPRFFGLPLMSSAFVEGERTSTEETIEDRVTKTTTNLAAFSLEQRFRPRRTLEIRYSYRYERNRTLIVSGTDPFDLTVTVPRLQAAAVIDRRDDPFNPARGWFASQSLEYSTPGLGSDLGFIKSFSQFQAYRRLGRSAVLASNVRFGAARAFDDQVLIPSERFVTGGGASVRGYEEDAFGTTPGGARTGGDGLFVFNQEVRFPVYRWMSGVGFFDAGNIFSKVSAFELNELRSAIGAGLRFDTPVGLLRMDLGVPLDRREGDSRIRWHFAIGHAF